MWKLRTRILKELTNRTGQILLRGLMDQHASTICIAIHELFPGPTSRIPKLETGSRTQGATPVKKIPIRRTTKTIQNSRLVELRNNPVSCLTSGQLWGGLTLYSVPTGAYLFLKGLRNGLRSPFSVKGLRRGLRRGLRDRKRSFLGGVLGMFARPTDASDSSSRIGLSKNDPL